MSAASTAPFHPISRSNARPPPFLIIAFNPTAAQDPLAIVEDGGLAGRHTGLGRLESNLAVAITGVAQEPRLGRRRRAN